MLAILFFTIVLLYLLHRFLTANYEYWKKKGVPNPPVNTFFGNLRDSITLKKSLGQIYTDIYRSYTDFRYVGFYKIRTPGLLIRDPEIVKDILVKDFNNFQHNDIDANEKSDPLLAKNPFGLRGHKWKVTRALLSTCFSSGKLKNIFPLMVEVSKNLVKYLERECASCLETKEVSSKFTIDNVASCAFGLDGRSFLDKKAEFREVGRQILEPSFWMGIKHMCLFLFPSLSKIISIKFVPDNASAYFRSVVTDTLKYREKNNIIRNDFLDSMAQLKLKPSEYGFDDDDVTGHAMSFFIDGFETSSISLSFALYGIASNPDVQNKLRAEIVDVLGKHGGNMTYEAIQEMTYLECVLSEAHRLYPPGLFLFKRCTNACVLPPVRKGAEPIQLEVGTSIIIPLYALQNDELYYRNPAKFDPDRFSENNKQYVVKGTYLPFGDGPRTCIAQRFAQLQVKVGIVAIVANFELTVNKKTIEPIEMDPRHFMVVAKGGLWLDYKKLNK